MLLRIMGDISDDSSRYCIIKTRKRRKGEFMAAQERIEAPSTFSKLIVYATVISGFVAAYLMYKANPWLQ